MRFSVQHRTSYRYTSPVALSPHVIRLRPRIDGSLTLCDFDLAIEPTPAGRAEALDHEGNLVTNTWFQGATSELSVTSKFTVETTRDNPFDWLPEPALVSPWPAEAASSPSPSLYSPAMRNALAPYLRLTDSGPAIAEFTNQIRQKTAEDSHGGSPLSLLAVLNQSLWELVEREIRVDGHPQTPSETLARKQGACRDRAVLFMEVCRRCGIAARYVSGYQRYGHDHDDRFMHAWPEVYLPGGGWRGYDPTHGTALADEHVAVAAAADPIDATPIQGSYFGNARSQMTAQVDIEIEL